MNVIKLIFQSISVSGVFIRTQRTSPRSALVTADTECLQLFSIVLLPLLHIISFDFCNKKSTFVLQHWGGS